MISLLAHGVGARGDLPLPLWQFAWGAAVAVVLSFAGLGLLWHRPKLRSASVGKAAGAAANKALLGLGFVVRVAMFALFVVTIVAAFIGPQDKTNIAAIILYVMLWVVLQTLAAVFGDFWSAVSPFDTLARVVERFSPERPEITIDGPRTHFPALVGLFTFLFFELCFHDPANGVILGWVMVTYTLAIMVGVYLYGREWLRVGEGFTVLFVKIAAISPFFWRDGGLRFRYPFSGLSTLPIRRGTNAVVLMVLGGTTFDGVSRTTFWRNLVRDTSDWEGTLYNTFGMIWTIGMVAVAYLVAVKAAAAITDSDPTQLADDFLPSLVPITLAYAIAHYFSLAIFEGQNFFFQISDPFAQGWNLFGTADNFINYLAVSTSAISWVQAAAIVLGHVAAVVIAHDRSLELFKHDKALKSQYPMLAVMVLYTVTGLWLLMNS